MSAIRMWVSRPRTLLSWVPTITLVLLLSLFAPMLSPAQDAPSWAGNELLQQDRGPAALEQAMRKLRTTARLLHTTAHPDDEDGGMLVLESRARGASVVLMTLTRGEGGQNKVGNNFSDELGILRTLELLAADNYYGVQQRFSHVSDFGYSKNANETFLKWGGHEPALADMVRVIRTFRPDVITARFSGTPRDGHGNHEASAILTREAFRAAADPARFPDQIRDGLAPWQARKLYTGLFRSPEAPTVSLDTGVDDPLLGMSYLQFAVRGLAHQQSQGVGSFRATPGPHLTNYKLDSTLGNPATPTADPPPAKESDFFDGIDTSLPGLADRLGNEASKVPFLRPALVNLQKQVERATAAAKAFPPSSAVVPLLAGARMTRSLIAQVSTSALSAAARVELLSRLDEKRLQFESAAALAGGLELSIERVDSASQMIAPGERVTVVAQIKNDPTVHLQIKGVDLDLPPSWEVVRDSKSSKPNGQASSTGTFKVGSGPGTQRPIKSPDPEYTEEARKAHLEGTVFLSVTVGEDGRPRDIKVVRGLGMGLDEKAVEALRQWQFNPATKDGKPTTVQVLVEVNFKLYDTPPPSVAIQPANLSQGVRPAAVGPALVPSAPAARFAFQVPPNAEPTRPYWHRDDSETEALEQLDQPQLATLPFPVFPVRGHVTYTVGGETGTVRATARAQGMRHHPLAVVPAFNVWLEPATSVFSSGPSAPGEVKVNVTSERTTKASGDLRLELPTGWRSEPEMQKVDLSKMGESASFLFKVFPSDLREGKHQLGAVLESGAARFTDGFDVVSREDLGTFYYYRPATQRVSVVDVKLPAGLEVGYVMGAGDDIPTVLRGIGIDVHLITPQEVASGDLSAFGTIVMGIRAYDTRADVRDNNKRLLDYVSNGGTLIVQYNSGVQDFNAGKFTPFTAELGRDRVSVEESPVEILKAADPIFRYPNQISAAEFEGWVQERGLNFMSKWDPQFEPLLASGDPGEKPLQGGMLRARVGKGTYIYTGYAFFRQLPHGVPGAVRLFVNLLSAGHAPQ